MTREYEIATAFGGLDDDAFGADEQLSTHHLRALAMQANLQLATGKTILSLVWHLWDGTDVTNSVDPETDLL